VGGVELFREPLPPDSGWVPVEMRVGPDSPGAYAARDVVVELRSSTYRSAALPGKDLGVLLGRVSVRQEGSGQIVMPNLRTLALSVGLALLLYLLLVRSGGLFPERRLRGAALVLTLIAALVLGWGTAVSAADVGLAVPHLATALGGSYILLILAERLLPRVFRGEGRTALRWVAVALSVAFLMRFGVSGLPQTHVVDLPYHTKWLNVLLNGGFMELYLPGELSSVPPEWGLDVLIPKSPLFYVVMWPLGLLRGLDLPYLMMLAVSLIDALVVLGIYALVRRVNVRGAVFAAILYAVVPLSLRAFTYGILPTIFAQVLTLGVLLIAVLWGERLLRPPVFAGLALLLGASLIAFPTALAFNSYMVVALGVGYVWRGAAPRGTLPALVGVLVLALGLAFALYYGLYVEPFVTQTLPALGGGVSLGGRELWPGGVWELLGWTAGYAIVWGLWLLIPVALWLLWGRGGTYGKRLWVLLAAWLVLFLIGVAANLRIDMIGKHIYYTLPAACIAGGLVFAHLWHRLPACAARALCLLTLAYLVWSSLGFFAGRL
jgi:hypothetical protein